MTELNEENKQTLTKLCNLLKLPQTNSVKDVFLEVARISLRADECADILYNVDQSYAALVLIRFEARDIKAKLEQVVKICYGEG